MVKTTKWGNISVIEKDSYICSTTEFTPETDVEDGCQLEVVDETATPMRKVVGYYVAYHGYWCERQDGDLKWKR